MSTIVPASTKIKYKRIPNIDTDRLQRRLAWLNENKIRRIPNIDTDRLQRRLAWLNENKIRLARGADRQMEIRHLARELLSIEAELEKRGELAS